MNEPTRLPLPRICTREEVLAHLSQRVREGSTHAAVILLAELRRDAEAVEEVVGETVVDLLVKRREAERP